LIKQNHKQQQVSVGTGIKAMILNGLGFVNRTLHLTMPHFLRINQSVVCSTRLDPDILAEYLIEVERLPKIQHKE